MYVAVIVLFPNVQLVVKVSYCSIVVARLYLQYACYCMMSHCLHSPVNEQLHSQLVLTQPNSTCAAFKAWQSNNIKPHLNNLIQLTTDESVIISNTTHYAICNTYSKLKLGFQIVQTFFHIHFDFGIQIPTIKLMYSVSNQLMEHIFLTHNVPPCRNTPGARFLAEVFYLTWSSYNIISSSVSIGASPNQ